MAIRKSLKDYLDKNKVLYAAKKHKEAYTAQEIARIGHISGKLIAKTIILKFNNKLVMAVLPGHLMIDTVKFKRLSGAKTLRLAKEKEFSKIFPGCKTGAMPPFGNLYNIPVVVDKTLSQSEFIVFRGGTYKDIVKIRYKDFARLVKPQISSFTKLAETTGRYKP